MTAMPPGFNAETKRAVLNMALAHKSVAREVPNRVVRDAAATCGVSPRTVRRWIATEQVPDGSRTHWTPTDDQVKRLLADFGGSVRGYRLALVEAGEEVPSLSTMQRGFRDHVPTVHRVWARSGYQSAKQLLPTMNSPERQVNDEWSMDDSLLPVWCRMPDGTVGKVWMQALREASSRYILATTYSPAPFNAESAVETIASAIQGHYLDDGVFVGGKPRALRSDRGSNFVAEATSLGLIAADIERRYSGSYEPQQNGGIERYHRTIKDLTRDLPGYDRTAYKKGDPRKAAQPPNAVDLMFYEEVVGAMQKRVHRYNNVLVHSAHGRTPAAEWTRQVTEDPTLVERADDTSIRAAMRQTGKRVLRRRRIEWADHFYALHPYSVQEFESGTFDADEVEHREHRIAAFEGRKVVLRFLHGRVEYLSVYTEQGEYLGDAVREDLQTVEQAAETKKERRKHIKTMRDTLDDIAKNDAAAIALRREEALSLADPLYEPDDDTDEQGPVADSPPDAAAPDTDTDADTRADAASATPSTPTATRQSTPQSRMEAHRQQAQDQYRSHVENAATHWVINDEIA